MGKGRGSDCATAPTTSLVVTGTLFEDNRAGDDGGAVFSEDVGAAFRGVTFRRNLGVSGGAVSLGLAAVSVPYTPR